MGCTATEELNPRVEFHLPPSEAPPITLPTRIAFGSCSDPREPMPALDVATALEPDVFLWLGDNVYADTTLPHVMRTRYAELAAADAFLRLRDRAHFLATWDDHDYGQNDAGKEYPMRAASRDIFLEFWQEPASSERWDRDGIYTSYTYEAGGRRLQIILLDTRYHRDALTPNDGTGLNDYLPSTDEERTLLGEAQWAWLETELMAPADLRLIASSIQLGHSYNGYESWTLFPHERRRFVELIAATRAERVLVLSGDVHWGELSRLPVADGYDLYDVTASGINQDWPFVAANDHRIGEAVPEHNVGLLTIDWQAATVETSLYDVTGALRARLEVRFDQLSF